MLQSIGNEEHVKSTAQILLAYLSAPKNSTPNDMLEGIVAGKQLLHGILEGSLVLCSEIPDPQPQMPTVPEDVEPGE